MIGPEIAITIRPEAPGDEKIIFALTEAAFSDMEHSDGDEQHLVDRLRADGDLALSLVAEDGERIVGQIAFSPVEIADGAQGWFGLGPVSVWPELQRKGIGGALIRRGIADLRARGARGIVLLGSDTYYPRFGFEPAAPMTYAPAPARYFQALVLDGDKPSGAVSYARAFG
ncbi:GNAT family N-acetyltransferase [Qipengyuania nanhaisediminis]|uniref:GNAT family N-acetyltransferase n=1 Tax=Qipengyuania nanhaisediminis TaxID=604088 RepID=UPI0038B2C405